jgi:hypothetical protein
MLGSERYRRWMNEWETALCLRDTRRVVLPFEWGVEWTSHWPVSTRPPSNGDRPEQYLRRVNREVIANGQRFFGYQAPRDFVLENGSLRFTSAAVTPFEPNNIVHAQWFEAPKSRRAVVLVPHWNAAAHQHVSLAKALQRLGISVLRLSPPYHDQRRPSGQDRAEYAVSANLARTVDATRQAVVDIRSCCDWLEERGYKRLGLVGISLGACYGFLASAHEPRLATNFFTHLGTSYADIVWTGLSTRHIREGLERGIDLDRLREIWRMISPMSYTVSFAQSRKRSLFVRTTYDSTVLPIFSEQLLEEGKRCGWPHRVVVLPCGHYTSGETPFKFLIGYHACSFVLRNL